MASHYLWSVGYAGKHFCIVACVCVCGKGGLEDLHVPVFALYFHEPVQWKRKKITEFMCRIALCDPAVQTIFILHRYLEGHGWGRTQQMLSLQGSDTGICWNDAPPVTVSSRSNGWGFVPGSSARSFWLQVNMAQSLVTQAKHSLIMPAGLCHKGRNVTSWPLCLHKAWNRKGTFWTNLWGIRTVLLQNMLR